MPEKSRSHKMKIVQFRREEFGYLAISDTSACLLDERAGAHLHEGCEIDCSPFFLKEMHYSSPFHLSAPLVAFVEITRACNLRCKHCYISGGDPRENELSIQELFSLLRELKSMGVLLLVLTGGEPLLRKGFLDIINFATSLGFYMIEVITNGILLNDALTARLPTNIMMAVSVDGLSVGPTRGISLDRIQSNILGLQKRGISTSLWWNVNHINMNGFHDVACWGLDHGIDIFMTDILPLGRAKAYPELMPNVEDIKRDAECHEVYRSKRAVQHNIFKARRTLNPFTLMIRFENIIGACKGGRSNVYIASNGDIYPCNTAAAEGKYLAGNVRTSKFQEIWNHSFLDIRSYSRDSFESCIDCRLLQKNCPYRCAILSEINTGEPFRCGASEFLKQTAWNRTEFWSNF